MMNKPLFNLEEVRKRFTEEGFTTMDKIVELSVRLSDKQITSAQYEFERNMVMRAEMKSRATAKKACLIAMIDVLGFKNLLSTKTLDQLVEVYRDLQFRTAMDTQNMQMEKSYEKTVIKKFPINHVFFSDTILFWEPLSLSDTENGRKIKRFLSSIEILLHNALISGISLRGGISWGECMMAPEINMYVGRAIAYAHIVEESQIWVGVAFHPSIHQVMQSLSDVERYTIDPLLIRYSIPLKDGIEVENRPEYALKLIGGRNIENALQKNEESAEKDLMDNKRELEKVKAKMKNTRDFLKAIERQRAE